MPLQADIKDALEGDRDDLIAVLAEYHVRPSVLEESGSGGSGLLGKSTPSFRLDSPDGKASALDRQTTTHVVDALELSSEEDCEAVREEIANHDAWEGS